MLRYRVVCESCGGSGIDEESAERGPCVMCGGRGSFSEDEYWGDSDDQVAYDEERYDRAKERVGDDLTRDAGA